MVAITLPEAAQIAGYVTGILGCLTIVLRLAVSIPIVRRFTQWVREGWAEDRAEALDKALAFNGTGAFRTDMRRFYSNVNDFMRESAADRRSLHARLDLIHATTKENSDERSD